MTVAFVRLDGITGVKEKKQLKNKVQVEQTGGWLIKNEMQKYNGIHSSWFSEKSALLLISVSFCAILQKVCIYGLSQLGLLYQNTIDWRV